MHPLIRRRSAAVAACLLGLALAVPTRAADAKAPDAKTLDHYLYTSLRVVINHGVELYNAGRVEDCYDQFRQSLQELVPVLTGHPELQKTIKEALDKVENDPTWRAKMAARATMPNPEIAPVVRQKAFALRAVFNDVRAGLNPESKKPTPPVTATLWDRLGGEKGVSKVVDDFANLVGADPKVDITRGGKRKLDALTVADLKKKSVEFISAKTGGPLKYTGMDLRDAHKGMGITNEEFDAAVADFKAALAKNHVKPADADALLKIVEATRKDVVEGKKPVDKPKPGEGGTVKGKVMSGGKPLARGAVSLIDKDGKTASTAPIAADGTFNLDAVAPGTYKVTVTGGPPKYADKATSGLTITVKKGQQEADFDLMK